MWRALFFAVGVMLIVLGVECLVVDQYEISQNARIPDFIAKILDGEQADGVFDNGQYAAQNPGIWSGSSYGNSRFQASPYSPQAAQQQNYNGAGRNGQFRLTNFNGSSNRLSRAGVQAGGLNQGQVRTVHTRDWMPWSLLAAGTLVVLYTNATQGGYSKD